MAHKVWLVTGTSSGFGRALVDELLRAGEYVTATARNTEKIKQWQGNDHVFIQPMDVNDDDQTSKAVQATRDRWGRVDVLVNNAGWGYFGSVEEADEHEARAMMDANFWGAARVTRAVLPSMRTQRSGYVMNITSVAGILGTPGLGYYNASKHALEGLMKALSIEVKPLGIHVTNIEPGPFRTDWAGRSHLRAPATIHDYDGVAHAKIDNVEHISGVQDGSPELLAKAIVKLAGLADPPLHFVAGRDAFGRAGEELDRQRSDFDRFNEDEQHLSYGDEAYWE